MPEIIFDYALLGAEGERESVAVLVIRDRRTQMLFAHVVPRKGLAHEHGSRELTKDIQKMAYQEPVLKCDGEPSLRSVQEEVKRMRKAMTLLENYGMGGSQAKLRGRLKRWASKCGCCGRGLRYAWVSRKGAPMHMRVYMPWMVEHAADVLSKYEVGADGHTASERMKGRHALMKWWSSDWRAHGRKGYFLGKYWRATEAILGSTMGGDSSCLYISTSWSSSALGCRGTCRCARNALELESRC